MVQVLTYDHRALQDAFGYELRPSESSAFVEPGPEAVLLAVKLQVGAGNDSDELILRMNLQQLFCSRPANHYYMSTTEPLCKVNGKGIDIRLGLDARL